MDNTNNVMLFDYNNIFCEVSKIIASLVMITAISAPIKVALLILGPVPKLLELP